MSWSYVSNHLQALSVEPVKHKLVLTHKKSLVQCKEEPPTQYTDFSIGGQVQGFVVSIKDNGILVAFYNNVKVSIIHQLFVNSEVSHSEV